MKEYEGVPMDPHMFDHLIGKGLGTRNMDYTWRDVSLYGVGVGAKMSELPYFYERCEGGMKALPTFALLPYINSITMDQYTKVPLGTNEFVIDYVTEKLGYTPTGLHMAMDLKIDGEIDPYKGTFITEDRLNNVLDRGEGKGIVSDCAMEVYDIAGRHVSTLHSYHYNAAFGGFGGEKFKSEKLEYPDREPERVTHVYAQIRNVCFPGCNVTLQMWKIEEGKLYFKFLDEEGRLLLGNGILEYK